MRAFGIRPTATMRALVFLTGDLIIWTAAMWGAFLIRFEGAIPPRYLAVIPTLLVLVIPIKLGWYALCRLYRLSWRSVGLSDFISMVKANTLASGTIAIILLVFRHVEPMASFPRSVLIVDYVLATCGVTVFRAARRGWQLQRESLRARRRGRGTAGLLLLGAGAAGVRLVQNMEESTNGGYRPVGFIDDDPAKHGMYIRGLRVFGGREILARVVREQAIEEVLIAIPSATPARLREIVEDVRRVGVQRIKVLPGMAEWLAGRATFKDIREVHAQDLLGRVAIRIQYDALKTYLVGRRVLVTGAAGSIGSELVRQLLRFGVERVVAADISESGLFELEEELRRELPGAPLQTTIADIRDEPKMTWLMATARPHLVFHASAYKHVPLMERDVDEAVKTNVFGTLVAAEAALRHEVETFVFVSTDKAVNPTSILGATKRLGEMITQALGGRSRTRFLSVRFGNVLGSRGSIIPILQEQIRKGGPVTITHPDMVRYFMTIQEAVLLVLQTPLMATPGSIFMLDMGKPVRIVDLVRDLIKLSGLEEDRDIPVVFTGVRAGEKMEEDLVAVDEQLVPTVFDGILEAKSDRAPDEVTLRLGLRELEAMVRAMDVEGIRRLLTHLAALPPVPLSAVRQWQQTVPVPGVGIGG